MSIGRFYRAMSFFEKSAIIGIKKSVSQVGEMVILKKSCSKTRFNEFTSYRSFYVFFIPVISFHLVLSPLVSTWKINKSFRNERGAVDSSASRLIGTLPRTAWTKENGFSSVDSNEWIIHVTCSHDRKLPPGSPGTWRDRLNRRCSAKQWTSPG